LRDFCKLPTRWIDKSIKNINEFKMEDFELIDYNPQGIIKAKMAV